jgi:hypothetical protein
MRDAAILVALILMLAAAASAGAETDPDPGKVTVSLGEVRRLEERIRELEQQRERDQSPPVRAAVERFELEGRLLDDGIDFTAHVEVEVLTDATWVRLPLLRRGPRTQLATLPEVKGAAFAAEGDQLVFVTRERGSYSFDLALLQRAERADSERRVELELPEAGLARARIAYDAGLFRLTGEARGGPEGSVIFPQNNRLSVAWQVKSSLAEESAPAQKLELEPFVKLAHASSVATLEGRALTRVRYELRFAGRKTIELEIPEGVRVERVYRNGSIVAFALEGSKLAVDVVPARAGDESGSVELVLSRATGEFHLSGSLGWKLPSVSWPVHELFLDLHLPGVFAYRWRGGSLSPVAGAPGAPEFSYHIPLPGEKLSFHQYLLTGTSPDVQLDYAVALEGRYFHVQRDAEAATHVPYSDH